MASPYVHFLQEISSIEENDYGDFMRKVNEYLIELKENKNAVRTLEIEQIVDEIQRYIQFRPNWKIPETRERLTQDIEKLIHLEAVNSL